MGCLEPRTGRPIRGQPLTHLSHGFILGSSIARAAPCMILPYRHDHLQSALSRQGDRR
jgi:hypothetical protein